MLIINKPQITEVENGIRIHSSFIVNEEEDVLWYEVEKEYGAYLTTDRADAFVVGLLWYAIRNSHDIKVLSAMSEKLYYNLTKYVIPQMSKVYGLKPIEIECDLLENKPLNNANAVGTGLSCGIDSFSTIADHLDVGDSYKITHFTFFNVGSHGSNGGDAARRLFEERAEFTRTCALDLGKDFVKVDSNISEILNMSFPETHTFRSMSAVLILQGLFSKYYHSSGVPLENFFFNKRDQAYYDIFTLGMLSNENINLTSTCATLSRVDKTKLVSTYQPSYKYLNVCIVEAENCGKCSKCLRTLFTLELIGSLEKYKPVFDMKNYHRNRSKFIAQVVGLRKKNVLLDEIYREMKKVNFKVTPYTRFIGVFLNTQDTLISTARKLLR